MLRSVTSAGAAVFLLAAPFALQAQQAGVGPRVDAIFARYNQQTPGCAVGLAKDGRTLYTHGYGSANLEYDVPLTDSTILESGSVAKQFTASALVLLAQDGKLSLDDDIRKYLPEVPDFGHVITIRNLLTHTSGLRDQWGLLGIEGRGPGTQVHSPATTLDLVVHQKMLNFPPGSEYLYSNTGYALAAIIVQRVSGQSLPAFTKARFFGPLGMTHTQWRDDYTRIVKNRATAYSLRNGEYHQDMPFTDMIGNSGVLSTMRDLLVWNANLDHPVVGGPSYVTTMETPMTLTSGRAITYALGLEVTDYDGTREVSHSGSTAGYRTYLGRFPEQHVSVAVWCNDAGANPVQLGHRVADLVLEKHTVAAAQPRAEKVEVPASALAQWAGVYRDPHTDQTMNLEVSDGVLGSSERAANRRVMLAPMGGATFRVLQGQPQGTITFRGAPGTRVGVLALSSGDTSRFEEVHAAPAAIALHDYTGVYASDELDVRLTIVARDGKLYLTRRPADEFQLRPQYADDFASGGGLGTLRFARGADGKVVGFSIYAGRVLDVRFHRVNAGR